MCAKLTLACDKTFFHSAFLTLLILQGLQKRLLKSAVWECECGCVMFRGSTPVPLRHLFPFSHSCQCSVVVHGLWSKVLKCLHFIGLLQLTKIVCTNKNRHWTFSIFQKQLKNKENLHYHGLEKVSQLASVRCAPSHTSTDRAWVFGVTRRVEKDKEALCGTGITANLWSLPHRFWYSELSSCDEHIIW